MGNKFKKYIDQLPRLLEDLGQQELRSRNNLVGIPKRGIYVFFEHENPIYVGRSDRMKERIQQHGRPSSGHNSAPFAFNLAKDAAKRKGIDVNKKRDELEKGPAFRDLFKKAKESVLLMSVQVIKIDDPILQTLFEVYAAIALNTTKYNDFETH